MAHCQGPHCRKETDSPRNNQEEENVEFRNGSVTWDTDDKKILFRSQIILRLSLFFTSYRTTRSTMSSLTALEDIELYPHGVTKDTATNFSSKTEVNILIRVLHSFKRRENKPSSLSNSSGPMEGDTSPLNRSLKGRHLQFIAIGGSIGAGLFIGCGKALAIGGPGWLLIAFFIVGLMLLCVMHALGELAAVYPISGTLVVFVSNERVFFKFFNSIYR